LEVVASNPTIILDGAHNPAAMRSLAHALRRDFQFENLILAVGIMEDKDIKGILDEIIPLAQRVIYTRPAYYRAADPERLMDASKGYKKTCEVRVPLSAAIERAKNAARKEDLILITGSLFTVGEAESYLDPLHYPSEDI
jgi:dihydrofolate synthase/folylpolyglutamate synthase